MQKETHSTSSSNSAGIVSVIFGILSLVVISIFGLATISGIILGVIGLIFGIIQRKHSNNKWANWGIGISIIGIIINVLILIWLAATIAEFARQVQELQASGALDPLQYQNVPA
jgi:heme/copper-type cytochrome/quinol oxidase subunit 2